MLVKGTSEKPLEDEGFSLEEVQGITGCRGATGTINSLFTKRFS